MVDIDPDILHSMWQQQPDLAKLMDNIDQDNVTQVDLLSDILTMYARLSFRYWNTTREMRMFP